ncbi:hypothetical protein JRO89_XS08G0135600 [Xanthoceras sorbifolium]|uniref:Uncharacterized protein n=1 Tax=Xanthoceras sorbifolium TaxID=99658 RepID=A0ABQ8HPW1_9ROSI|nr:hypothetical protein JRO89_XS08G0135600 [Xanthoceras sorbifolium]
MTENYVVVPEMSLRYSAKNLVRAKPTPLYKFELKPNSIAFKHGVASVEVPLFVTFHFINAYKVTDNKGHSTARLSCQMPGSRTNGWESALEPDEHGRGMDMCSKYAYASGAKRPCNFPNALTKLDLVNKKGAYAVLLDASTFEEIARAKLPCGIPYGLHGCSVPKK